MSNFDEKTVDRIKRLDREVERLRVKESGKFIALTTPLTSTAWDGDAHSSESATKLDMSSVFTGYPTTAIKAVLLRIASRDSAAVGTTGLEFSVGPAAGFPRVHRTIPVGGDVIASSLAIVPCDAAGDIYYYIAASGTNTLDAWIEVWGYWL